MGERMYWGGKQGSIVGLEWLRETSGGDVALKSGTNFFMMALHRYSERTSVWCGRSCWLLHTTEQKESCGVSIMRKPVWQFSGKRSVLAHLYVFCPSLSQRPSFLLTISSCRLQCYYTPGDGGSEHDDWWVILKHCDWLSLKLYYDGHIIVHSFVCFFDDEFTA